MDSRMATEVKVQSSAYMVTRHVSEHALMRLGRSNTDIQAIDRDRIVHDDLIWTKHDACKRERSWSYDPGNPNDGSREKLWKVKKTSALPANPTPFGNIGFFAYARGNSEGSRSCGVVGRQSSMSVSMGAFCHADGNQSIDTAWSAWSGHLMQEIDD